MDVTPALTAYAAAIASHEWEGLRELLADDASVTLLHTGEVFGPDAFVAFNRDYPSGWVFHAEEVVGAGRRGVLRARVVVGEETYHVATFGSVDQAGRLTDLLEVWTEAVAPHPTRNPERGTT